MTLTTIRDNPDLAVLDAYSTDEVAASLTAVDPNELRDFSQHLGELETLLIAIYRDMQGTCLRMKLDFLAAITDEALDLAGDDIRDRLLAEDDYNENED